MAKSIGGIERALLKYPDLDLEKLRIIGWGAGQVFQENYHYLEFPLEFTVCPVETNQGRVIHGIQVRSPEELMKEDAENILIVIFATHSSEIMNQIREKWGNYRCVQAITHDHKHGDIDQLQAFSRVFKDFSFKRTTPKKASSIGIFVQGPIFPYTAMVLAWQRLAYPEAHQCLVTWDHQDESLIKECRPWIDNLILLPQPQNMFDSRNAIARSSRAGADYLFDFGVDYSVRSRSDTLITGSIYRALDELFDDGTKNPRKFGFHAASSWKHIPFHFSERFLISRSADMKSLWSLPEDNRKSSEIIVSTENHFLDLHKATVESWIWKSYAHKLGYATDDLADSFRFAYSHMLPMDDQVNALSLKHVPLFNLKLNRGFPTDVKWWKSIYADLPTAIQRAQEESRLNLSIDDFFKGRVG